MYTGSLVLGVLGGTAAGALMLATGMIRERGASAVALIAIAAFWPVFAVAAQRDIALHFAAFALFAMLAVAGYRLGLWLIAASLAGHGLFDALIGLDDHPGPGFWPAFCAGVDIALAGILTAAIARGRTE